MKDTIPAPPVQSENPMAELRKVIAMLVEDRDRYKADAESFRCLVDTLERQYAELLSETYGYSIEDEKGAPSGKDDR